MKDNLLPSVGGLTLCILGIMFIVPARADFTFDDFSDISTLSLNGDATQFGNTLRIHNGSAWFITQQFIRDGFATRFQFQIADLDSVAPDCEGITGGDGFAFVIQNESVSALGFAGGALGYGGSEPVPLPGDSIANSLAVEFDTWCNDNLNDPNGNHISVHTRGTEPNSADHALASLGSTTTIPNMSDGNVHTVKIVYIPGTLSIFLDDLITPVLIISVDLATTLSLSRGRAWVGFTAGVAAAFENHDILNSVHHKFCSLR
jgi:hypothetical protein